MRLIIDNNILFSLLKPDSFNSYLFDTFIVGCYAPKFILDEFKNHEDECRLKSKLSKDDFEKQKQKVIDRITILEVINKEFLLKAENSCSDEDDEPYIALGLQLNMSIWSNNKHLKEQNLVDVFTTADLVKLLN